MSVHSKFVKSVKGFWLLALVLVMSLSVSQISIAQELPKNLVYANKNLRFEKLYILGEFKILQYSSLTRQNDRFMYLMDEANTVVDKMQIRSNDYILIRSDSTFSFKNLSDLGEVMVSEKGFVTKMFLDVSGVFSDDYLSPLYVFDDYIIGDKYHEADDCTSYHFVVADSLKYLKGTLTGKKPKYNLNEETSLLVLDEDLYRKAYSQGFEDVKVSDLFDKDKSCLKRTKYPYYGWLNSSLHQDHFTFYERKAGKLFSIDVSEKPDLSREFELPIADRNKEGWKYIFDFRLKKHYAVKKVDVTEVPAGTGQKKARKIKKVFSYELYQLLPAELTFRLKPLYKLPFDPILVDNDLVYEIVQESKKGSALYFHPLDPNYEYKKSTFYNY